MVEFRGDDQASESMARRLPGGRARNRNPVLANDRTPPDDLLWIVKFRGHDLNGAVTASGPRPGSGSVGAPLRKRPVRRLAQSFQSGRLRRSARLCALIAPRSGPPGGATMLIAGKQQRRMRERSPPGVVKSPAKHGVHGADLGLRISSRLNRYSRRAVGLSLAAVTYFEGNDPRQ